MINFSTLGQFIEVPDNKTSAIPELKGNCSRLYVTEKENYVSNISEDGIVDNVLKPIMKSPTKSPKGILSIFREKFSLLL